MTQWSEVSFCFSAHEFNSHTTIPMDIPITGTLTITQIGISMDTRMGTLTDPWTGIQMGTPISTWTGI